MSKKKLATNIGSLALIQGANYLLPLLSIPYLLRMLGVEGFGVIAYATAIAQIFVVLVDFGFNLTATRSVSVSRNDPVRINQIISGVYCAKFGLLAVCAFVYGVILTLGDFQGPIAVYWACFLVPVGNAIFPGWLFQGLEKMPLVSAASVTAKVTAVGAIFIFVHKPDDIVVAAVLQSAGGLFAGAIGLSMMRRAFPPLSFRLPALREVTALILDGRHVFASQLSAFLVNGSQMLILGAFHGSAAVGAYAVADKLVKAANSAQTPICGAIFPRASALFAESPQSGIRFVKRVGAVFAPMLACGCLVLLFGAEWIIKLIVGHPVPEAALVLRIMAFIPLSVFLDNLIGTQILLNLGRSKEFMAAIVVSGVVGVGIALLFVPAYGAVASAVGYLIAQLTVLLMMGYFFLRPAARPLETK